jgi:hypothetical protein
MAIFRLVGFTIAAAAAVAVFLLAGPDDARRFTPIAVEGNQQLIDGAVAAYEADAQAAGEDIQLQQLASSFIARDLLFVNAGQLDALSEQISVLSAQTVVNAQAGDSDDRIAGLLLVGVLTLAFHGATSLPQPTPARRRLTWSAAPVEVEEAVAIKEGNEEEEEEEENEKADNDDDTDEAAGESDDEPDSEDEDDAG